MKSISGRRLAKILEQRGWVLLRVKGSHHYYGRPDSRTRLSLPIHGSADIKIGILKSLMKLANLEEEDLK